MALLTPFYFLKAGSLVNAAVLYSGIGLITLFFSVKTVSKFIGLFPVGIAFKFSFRTNMFNTLMMSTGLTFGTISAL
jgi:Kef-type K+ transport system membrane component KefB